MNIFKDAMKGFAEKCVRVEVKSGIVCGFEKWVEDGAESRESMEESRMISVRVGFWWDEEWSGF
ncbi:hypothetical protein GGR09_000634 [Bartonella heixiaziensis]